MAVGSTGAAKRDLVTLFESGSMTGLSDRELLERVTSTPDAAAETAFEALVLRHGPMVFRVCRNLLGRAEDADDAFQATFLVLVQRRRSIRKEESLASWLFGVASRVSARARVDAARRRKVERGVRLAVPPPGDADAADPAEHGSVVQEEVRRLPEKYRGALLLCYWEGLTHEQAALRLGCPVGTVRSRIARARELLRRRLARHGVASTAGAVTFLAGDSAPGSALLPDVAPHLVRSSVQAALRVAAGQPTVGMVPASVSALARSVLWSFRMTRVMKLATILSVGLVAAIGARSWGQKSRRPDPPETPDVSRRPTEPEADKVALVPRSQLVHVIEPPDMLIVEVLQALPGRAISGQRLVRPDGTISLGFYGEVEVAGLTVKEAKARIVRHLRKYLSDDALGLEKLDSQGVDSRPQDRGSTGTPSPVDTDRVFVEVASYNSSNYYIEGAVAVPGRLPFTGNERVLDVLHNAGGLTAQASRDSIRLVRSFPKGLPIRVLPVDYDQITMGTDDSTNYQILPHDRLVVPQKGMPPAELLRSKTRPPAADAPGVGMNLRTASPPRELAADGSPPEGAANPDESEIDAFRRRLESIEGKLDRLLKRLEDGPATPGQSTRPIGPQPGAS